MTMMRNSFILEICSESLECAIAAERAGTHRIELCSNMVAGGITPSAGLMEAARTSLHLPIHVLIRPRPGDFLYSPAEFEVMRRDIQIARQLGMDGVAIGILNGKSRVDVKRTRELVELARPLQVTFHRAFDEAYDLHDSLESVIQTGADRILASGRKRRAVDGISNLARLVNTAQGRITIAAGGRIRAADVARIIRGAAIHEFHTSLGISALGSGNPLRDRNLIPDTTVYESGVRAMAALLGSLGTQQ